MSETGRHKTIHGSSAEKSQGAQTLATRHTQQIGLITDQPNPQYVVDMQTGILSGLDESTYQLVVRPCDRGSPTLRDDICRIVRHQRLFGVILTPSISEDEELVEALRSSNCPYVRIAAISLDAEDRMIETHDFVGAAQAARHLAELGHRRIAHVRGPDHFLSSHERLRGFRMGLAVHELHVDDRYVLQGGYTFESGVYCGERLLAMPELPTAVFAGNDEMAVGIYQSARRAGVRIPEDLSIVGFDDGLVAQRICPTLTTVRLPIRYMGTLAAQLLVSANDEASMEPPLATSVIPRLVVRESTAPPRRANGAS